MLSLIVILIIIGIALHVLQMFVPIDRRIMTVIYILLGVWLVVSLLGLLGVNVPIIGNLK